MTKSVDIVKIEKPLLQMPQVECPVYHRFGPGIYIREAHLPQGAFVIGHRQKTKHVNIMLQGAVAILDNGTIQELHAPLFYVGEPGRKAGFIIKDVVWQNIYATEETDIDKLEAMFLDKSDEFINHEEEERKFFTIAHEPDRVDFRELVSNLWLSEEEIRKVSENEEDQIPFPPGTAPKVVVRDSFIEGKGIFLSAPSLSESVIGPARINGKRTPIGRYTNHSPYPNAKFKMMENGDIYLIADRYIPGCQGGGRGTEVTVDYRQALRTQGIYADATKKR